jgi:hypothetical protein
MALLAVQSVVRTGLNPAYTAAAGGGDTIPNTAGQVFLHVKNGGGSSINVTLDSQTNCDQGFDHDEVIAVPNGGERMIGPFPARFQDSGGLIHVAYSAVTSVTVAAIKVAAS